MPNKCAWGRTGHRWCSVPPSTKCRTLDASPLLCPHYHQLLCCFQGHQTRGPPGALLLLMSPPLHPLRSAPHSGCSGAGTAGLCAWGQVQSLAWPAYTIGWGRGRGGCLVQAPPRALAGYTPAPQPHPCVVAGVASSEQCSWGVLLM